MNKPTDAQIKEFWEWCGLTWKWHHNPNCNCGAIDNDDSERSWYTKDNKLATRFYHDSLLIDLNNLFKYAVPKLKQPRIILYKGDPQYKLDKYWYCSIEQDLSGYIFKHNDDPALALFWAIYEVIHEKRRD